MARSFRFKPRYRGLAFSAMGIGGTLGVVAAVALGAAAVPLITGVMGVLLGAGYLASPTWKLEVVVEDDAFSVRSPKGEKFRVPWLQVKKLIMSPSTKTCFIDTGDPRTNVLIPGDGAPAPYDIADREALYAEIVAHVPEDKREEVETIEAAKKAANAEPKKSDEKKPDDKA